MSVVGVVCAVGGWVCCVRVCLLADRMVEFTFDHLGCDAMRLCASLTLFTHHTHHTHTAAIEHCASYLVDPASSHMLVPKIKPCMSKYKPIYTVKLRMAH